MATTIQLVLGVVSCLAFVLVARRASPWLELRIYAAGLVVAALVYLGFAVAGGATPTQLALEACGLAAFAAAALLSLRVGVWLLAAGWAAHAAWDVLLHGSAGAAFVPEWYPVACAAFDLLLACYLAAWAKGGRPSDEFNRGDLK